MRLYTFVYLTVDKSINELVGNPKVPLTNTPFPPSHLTHNGFGTSLPGDDVFHARAGNILGLESHSVNSLSK